MRFVKLFAVFFLFCSQAIAEEIKPVHAIAMHGIPKYAADFTHFDYVNPDALKGGTFKRYAIGTFDSFNPFIIKGIAPAGIGAVFETLLTGSDDEPFTEYGLIAESIEMPDDRSWAAFHLRPEAKFQDGKPITADDVIFSFNILKEKGSPFYRSYYADVEKVEKLGTKHVKFSFKKTGNRELPLIVGQLPILPKHYWENKKFESTTLEPILGSGAYVIDKFETGRYVSYKLDKNYWGKHLAVNKGLNNFDHIRFDYYRDTTVALESFKAGNYDVRVESESKKWATAYDFPAINDGRVKKATFSHQMPSGMQGFAINIRRPIFQNRKVRKALGYAFDFKWSNKNLFYGQYKRTRSYFDNSYLASTGLPKGKELELLNQYKDKLPKEVFTKEYNPPSSNGSGNIRKNLRNAFKLLKEAGWEVKDQKLTSNKTGAIFKFEIMLNSASAAAWERIALPFAKNLKKLGIEATVRAVDTNQYKNRLDSFDYDMIVNVWGQSLSPGNEQNGYWSSKTANQNGSRNYIGIKDSTVDSLIKKIVSSHDKKELTTAVKALDRVLLWNHYVIPHWHIPYTRVAYWDKFGIPEKAPMKGVSFTNWWVKAEK